MDKVIVCMKTTELPKLYPGSSEVPCVKCEAKLAITPAGLRAAEEMSLKPICPDCFSQHVAEIPKAEDIEFVLSRDQAVEIMGYRRRN